MELAKIELAEADPKGLVRESYNIDGITLGECRSIFLDWALSLISGQDVAVVADFLLRHRCYLRTFVTTPAPTVRPPSRIAKRRPSSMAIG